MSLASTAAPFNDDNQFYSEVNKEDTPINRKRLASSSAHNKTQKRMQPIDFNSEKVNTVLQSIHSNSNDNELGDFNPKRNQASAIQSQTQVPLNPLNKLLAPPESMREKQDMAEGFGNSDTNSDTNSDDDEVSKVLPAKALPAKAAISNDYNSKKHNDWMIDVDDI
jgi:hypothetical protein